MNSRQEMAKKIINQPERYKICEGCDSILLLEVTMCPNCHAYRFNQEREMVIETAELLGSREQQSVTAEDLGA